MDKINQYINEHKWLEWVIFFGVFWLCIMSLHLNRGLDDMIPGYHYWRKTDTYAQILNYYQNGLSFFDHGIFYNQMKSGGKAVAEFPLYYYFIAIQQKLFGNNIILLKINWIALLFFGQFSLYKIGVLFTKNYFLSLIIPISLFLSPVFTIYCLEFLPDSVAINLSFIGLYFFLKYGQSDIKYTLILGLVFTTIAGLMKPFYLIPFIALFLTYFSSQIYSKKLKKKDLLFFIPFLSVGLWFVYVNWYNAKVHSAYFLASTKPYWSIKAEKLEGILAKIEKRWWPDYLHADYWWVLIVILVLALVLLGIKKRKMALFIGLSVMGAMAFIILFYGMLKDHDYYIFPVLFLIPLVLFALIVSINYLIKNALIKNALGIIMVFILFQSLDYSWNIRQGRLKYPPINSTHLFQKYVGMEGFLEMNKVSESDLIITYSDKSPSYALILLNRKGWSGFQTFYRRQSVISLVEKDAKYILIDKSQPMKRDSIALEGVNMEYVADSNDLFLYKLVK